MDALARTYRTTTSGYARWGTGSTKLSPALAHIRMIRPVTRLWFDIIMPLTVLVVLTQGDVPVRTAIMYITAMVLIHTALTIVNDLQDVDSDRHSTEPLRALRPIASGVISRKLATREAITMGLAGVALCFLVSPATGLIVGVLAAAVLQHELPPIRTQSRPIYGQVAGFAGLLFILAAIVTVAGVDGLPLAMPYLLFVAIYMGIAEMLVKDIRDVDNDAAGGKHTTAVMYGAGRTTRVAAVVYALAAAAWVWFAVTYPVSAPPALVIAAAILVGWIGYVVWAAGWLAQRFSKAICISLHQGSIFVFTCVNLTTIVAIA